LRRDAERRMPLFYFHLVARTLVPAETGVSFETAEQALSHAKAMAAELASNELLAGLRHRGRDRGRAAAVRNSVAAIGRKHAAALKHFRNQGTRGRHCRQPLRRSIPVLSARVAEPVIGPLPGPLASA
jgi:hypothetical protein